MAENSHIAKLEVKKEKTKRVAVKFSRILIQKYQEAEVWSSGAIISYYILLSVFPIIIVVGNILPYLNIDVAQLLPYIENAIPTYLFDQVEHLLTSWFTQSSGGVLSIAVIGALWSASRGMNAMQVSMNKAYGVEPRRNIIMIRLFSLILTTMMILLIMVLVIIFGFGQLILEKITPIVELPTILIETFQSLKWPVTMSVLFVIFCLLYYFVPHAKIAFKRVLPGAAFSTIGWMLVSQLFAIYVEFFALGTKSYGTIGTFMILLIWLQVIGALMTAGAVINAALEVYQTGSINEAAPLRAERYIRSKVKNYF
ncbi:MAG: rane protein [Carnobacterium sp.]|uniref:YihY/virulence factor BrkB family protein n=1 Tax=Carnobacterium TaxID=2747 RepID=UPI00203F80CF|nr:MULTISPECIES: YihY/virulence factor BrkB family protein [Carnobacterium]MCM3511423.1 YihY/virulence factor BrkB family protein [Carnobacterium inhibens]MDN5372796.1 rane protein [Carnobacterium sp.]